VGHWAGYAESNFAHRNCSLSPISRRSILTVMPKRKIDFSTVRDIALTFPGVEESTSYGAPALKVKGQRIAGIPVNRSAEPGSLGLSIAIEDRDELIAAAPDVYYVTDHYVGYPCVLVRMSRINEDVLRELLSMPTSSSRERIKRKREIANNRSTVETHMG